MSRTHTDFFVNGHHCEVRYERREHYTGWIDGEKITGGPNTSAIADTLIADAKYRVETEIDRAAATRAVFEFIASKDGWVLGDAVDDAVFPESIGGAFEYVLMLRDQGWIEEGRVFTGLNDDYMWRVIGDAA